MAIKFGCAPSCWGVDDPKNPYLPKWERVLEEAHLSGFKGIELGPFGYLPLDAALVKEAFLKNDLTITAGTIFADIVDPNKHDALVDQTRRICDLITKLPAEQTMPKQKFAAPYLTYMDYFHSERSLHSGHSDRVPRLDKDAYQGLIRNITAFCKCAWEEYGVRPVLHPHSGGYIEFEDEIDRILMDLPYEISGLLLDTGHIYYAGGDPAKTLKKYEAVLNYVHFKDIDKAIYDEVMTYAEIDFFEGCGKGVMCPLGEGCIDYDAVMQMLKTIEYSGWITVEQERDPRSAAKSLDDVKKSYRFVSGLKI